MALNKLQLTLFTAALALMAGPALAVDYVQCNAMKVAYDREMAALIAERTSRHQYGLRSTVQPCGLPPIDGAPTSEVEAYKTCKQPAYESGVREWDKQNNQLDPKTGKPSTSRYAVNLVEIYADMTKRKCPTP